MSDFKYFKLEEFSCHETGENRIQHEFIHKLDQLREACGFPFNITSGYRSPRHSIEAKKQAPGRHTYGDAADIAVNGGAQRFLLVANALKLGFTGIGVAKGFVHVDTRDTTPVIWTY